MVWDRPDVRERWSTAILDSEWPAAHIQVESQAKLSDSILLPMDIDRRVVIMRCACPTSQPPQSSHLTVITSYFTRLANKTLKYISLVTLYTF